MFLGFMVIEISKPKRLKRTKSKIKNVMMDTAPPSPLDPSFQFADSIAEHVNRKTRQALANGGSGSAGLARTIRAQPLYS